MPHSTADGAAYDDGMGRSRQRKNSVRRSLAIVVMTIGVTLVVVCGGWALLAAQRPTTTEPTIIWPDEGTFAVAVGEQTALSPGAHTALPIASLTKLLTALVVLDVAPLTPDDDGPTFAMDAADVAAYEQERAAGGQALPISAGQVLTERELLELVLVASSNNHALTLTRHIFGDDARFLAAARSWLQHHDLESVSIEDATGMSRENRASAADLLNLARLAQDSPIVRELASRERTSVLAGPSGGNPLSFATTNDMLGAMAIDGLKTGHTDDAGFTAIITAPLDPADVDGTRVAIVVLGVSSEAQRSLDVARLLAAARGAGQQLRLVG